MKRIKYLQFPLVMIRNFNKKPEKCTQDILGFALVDFALKQNVTEQYAASQAMYNYYRGGGLSELKNLVDKYIKNEKITVDEDYFGFSGYTFNPEIEIEELLELFKRDNKLKELAFQNAQLATINDYFEVTGPAPEIRLQKYQKLKSIIEQHEAEHGKEPRPTIEKNLFFDLVKEPELFTAYIAIRSLEGQKKYVATNRPTIAGRMAGYKSAKLLPKKNPTYKKYYTRYWFDKILNQLMRRKLLKSILRQKNWSWIYLSTKINPSELGKAVGEKIIKNNIKRQNDEAKKALQQVYNETSL